MIYCWLCWVHRGFWTTPDKPIVIIAQNKTKGKHKVSALKHGTWNVRTMTPGLSDNLQQVSDARKTAVIINELCRLQVDIIALQEKDSLNLAS